MGVEFQSVEGLVVVSESESEPECTPSAVDSFPFPSCLSFGARFV